MPYGGCRIVLRFPSPLVLKQAFKVPDTLAAALMQIGGGSAFALMWRRVPGRLYFHRGSPAYAGSDWRYAAVKAPVPVLRDWLPASFCRVRCAYQYQTVPRMEALKPILIIPLISSLVVGWR